jgi:Sel1 repeat
MADRPNFIDLPSSSLHPFAHPTFPSNRDSAPSPRTGEIPPALSPLDAFALQGRLLARRFEEEENNGKRLSRLPPMMVANEIAKARPTFFQANHSAIPEEDITPRSAGLISNFQEVRQEVRPKSQYPTLHSDGGLPFGMSRTYPFHKQLPQVAENEHEGSPRRGYFDVPRSQSPELLDYAQPSSRKGSEFPAAPINMASTISLVQPSGSSLMPPSSPHQGRSLAGSPNIQSVLEDSNEEPDALSLGDSVDSLSLRTPASPFRPPVLPRSPSLASEHSVGSLPRPSFNFSRPMSRGRGPSIETKSFNSPFRQDSTSTRPSLEVPLRQDSGDSPITPFSNDVPHTPVDSIASDEYFNNHPASAPQGNHAASYTYSKYSLPRKSLKRESITAEEFFNQQIQWDDPIRDNDVLTVHDFSPRPSMEPLSQVRTDSPPRSKKNRPPNILIPQRSFTVDTSSSPRKKLHKSRPCSPSTMASNPSTIKARMAQAKASSQDVTLEDHFQRGIECHEAGSLQESTYHFRLAAKGGHSKAMLFYALACRHGWGMKPNAAEGVSWLQKAVDSAQLECADDEDLTNRGQQTDIVERKTHKAQFALSVYELGVSYMNGWGVQQDRSLALRCFEIAGNWGDADALAEAGNCYAEGIGCKRDLKKSARFYRLAEAKGVSMAGNSW